MIIHGTRHKENLNERGIHFTDSCADSCDICNLLTSVWLTLFRSTIPLYLLAAERSLLDELIPCICRNNRWISSPTRYLLSWQIYNWNYSAHFFSLLHLCIRLCLLFALLLLSARCIFCIRDALRIRFIRCFYQFVTLRESNGFEISSNSALLSAIRRSV